MPPLDLHSQGVHAGLGRLGISQQKWLVNFIHDKLGSDLSLTRLAQEVGMSAYHSARVFKATFGASPHHYVLDRRLQAASRALQKDQRRSTTDVWLSAWFRQPVAHDGEHPFLGGGRCSIS